MKKSLTGKQIRHLRALGHHLKPVVMLGREGVSDQVVAAVGENLSAHELIKVKLQESCELDREEVASVLAQATAAEQVQILGKTILLFRRSEKKKIELP